MKRIVTLVFTFSLLVAGSSPGRADESVTSPYGIFTRAKDAWYAQRYPDFLTYTISVNVSERGVAKTNHYHVAYDAKNEHVAVEAVSDEEKAAPASGDGVNVRLGLKRQGRTLFERRVGNPGDAVDLLGVPDLAPNYAFGLARHLNAAGSPTDDELVAQIRDEFHDPAPPSTTKELATAPGLKEIAVVSASHHDYDVRLLGIENVGGTDAYHLALRPLLDPRRLRLRELWVATGTFATLKLITSGNFAGPDVPWLVSFEEVNGARYIASEVAMDRIGVGDHRYDAATVSFENITASARPRFTPGSLLAPTSSTPEPGI